jgi:hypothetical protein
MKLQPLMGDAMSIVRTEKRERSVAGKLIKWAFVAFNLLMAVWIVGGLHLCPRYRRIPPQSK